MQQAWLKCIHRVLPRPMIDLLKVDALVRTREIGQSKPRRRNPTECDERDVAATHYPLTKDFETMVWLLHVGISTSQRHTDLRPNVLAERLILPVCCQALRYALSVMLGEDCALSMNCRIRFLKCQLMQASSCT